MSNPTILLVVFVFLSFKQYKEVKVFLTLSEYVKHISSCLPTNKCDSLITKRLQNHRLVERKLIYLVIQFTECH